MIDKPSKNGVLCIGTDNALLQTRVSLLARRYDVAAFYSLGQLAAAKTLARPDLVVLCHSLSQEDCGHYLEHIHERWPAVKVLAMATNTRGCMLSDATFTAYDGPAQFLLRVDCLLAGTCD